jgi:methionine-rich copper-binding protein CopC
MDDDARFQMDGLAYMFIRGSMHTYSARSVRLPRLPVIPLALLLILLWAGSGPAGAHAVVIESSPKDKEILTGAPKEVILHLNSNIEKSLVRISLTGSGGRTIPLPRPAAGGPPDRLVIPLPGIGPGDYVLRYRVLSTDGHATSGVLRFSVVNP